ncbi:MAG: ABC-2 family transporter protein [Coriobacteriia bacterium]|nr:ABC-2 family transporter protein [Coriobacteriia bacterium]
MRLYLRFLAIQLKSQMQYKASFFIALFGQFLVSFTLVLALYFMFDRFNSVQGFSFEEVLICFATMLMSFSLAETFARGFDTFPSMLGNGEFDRALVRPLPVIYQVLAMKVDYTRLARLLQAVCVFAYAIPNCGVLWSVDKILTLFLMVTCGFFVFFGLFVVYAAFSFFTIEGLEFMNIFTDGAREFGRYPFSIHGRNILAFVTFVIPLALVQYYPLLYLLGREQSVLYMFLPIVSLLFLIPCFAFFRLGLRHYKSTGS